MALYPNKFSSDSSLKPKKEAKKMACKSKKKTTKSGKCGKGGK